MSDHPEAVMLFAAGFGTRMGDLTRHQPKPMISVAGKPLVDHALDLVRGASVSRIVANLHYKPETLQAHLDQQGVTCVLETPNILETGGGLRNALPQLGPGPVATLNTDAVWRGPNPLSLLKGAWDPRRMEALLIVVPPERALGHAGTGDFTLGDDGVLIRGPGLIYGGAQIICTDRLADVYEHAFSLNVIWDMMLEAGTLYGLTYPGTWCDVGHPDGISIAAHMLGVADV